MDLFIDLLYIINPAINYVIPAGVSHKNLGDSPDFGVVGAYPEGQTPDLCSGKKNERPKADQNIAWVPLPQRDSVYGQEGPLKRHWR